MKTKALAAAHPKVNAFISYSHEDRKYAGQTKSVLANFGIDAFLAHEDIHVSHDWRDRILQELKRCDLFVALLSERFLASKWAPQEVGFIVWRPEVRVMPISLDETVACGFISNVQSKRIDDEGVTSDFLLPALVHNFPRTTLPDLIELVKTATTFRAGEGRLERLLPYFEHLTPTETKVLAENCFKNSQIWDAAKCRDSYLPELIRIQGKNMGVKNRRALQYQITAHDWYRAEEHE
jgi:hypothetical protein